MFFVDKDVLREVAGVAMFMTTKGKSLRVMFIYFSRKAVAKTSPAHTGWFSAGREPVLLMKSDWRLPFRGC